MSATPHLYKITRQLPGIPAHTPSRRRGGCNTGKSIDRGDEARISSLQGGMDKTKKEEKKERNTNKYPEDSTVRTLSIPTA